MKTHFAVSHVSRERLKKRVKKLLSLTNETHRTNSLSLSLENRVTHVRVILRFSCLVCFLRETVLCLEHQVS